MKALGWYWIYIIYIFGNKMSGLKRHMTSSQRSWHHSRVKLDLFFCVKRLHRNGYMRLRLRVGDIHLMLVEFPESEDDMRKTSDKQTSWNIFTSNLWTVCVCLHRLQTEFVQSCCFCNSHHVTSVHRLNNSACKRRSSASSGRNKMYHQVFTDELNHSTED